MTRILLVATGAPAPETLVFHHMQVVDFPALAGADVPCGICPVQVAKHTWQLAELVDEQGGYTVVGCSEQLL